MEQKIFEKAKELFLNYGVKSVTMDDIACEMGISKKTLYKYFKNKNSLVDKATTQIQQSCLLLINKINKEEFSPIKENFEMKKVTKEIFKNMGSSFLFQLKKYYPKIYERITTEESVAFSECIKNNIERGIKEGYYRKDLNIEIIVDFYLSLVFNIHEKDIPKNELLHLEHEALAYHTRAIATPKGIQELEKQIIENNNK